MQLWKKRSEPEDLTSAYVRESDERARAAGKGRPTPKRKDAEAANRRPIVGAKGTNAEEQKARRKAERMKAREEMLAGNERYLAPRDKGPGRRFLRDAVDRRWNVGEILLPVMLMILALSFVGTDWARIATMVGAYCLMFFGVMDSWLLWRRTKKRYAEAFGEEPPKGSALYVVLRSFQMRMSRIPRPQVARGAELERR
ncbi:DUF3043 domain-containing protein [Ornithinimicrobium sp. Y1847]|uniref:DUF3043 domain-containing protein n=1 Tax=Ornithinimicrobium sp. Y1847 TaxID=3405419 RepID=UPI003B672DB9